MWGRRGACSRRRRQGDATHFRCRALRLIFAPWAGTFRYPRPEKPVGRGRCGQRTVVRVRAHASQDRALERRAFWKTCCAAPEARARVALVETVAQIRSGAAVLLGILYRVFQASSSATVWIWPSGIS